MEILTNLISFACGFAVSWFFDRRSQKRSQLTENSIKQAMAAQFLNLDARFRKAIALLQAMSPADARGLIQDYSTLSQGFSALASLPQDQHINRVLSAVKQPFLAPAVFDTKDGPSLTSRCFKCGMYTVVNGQCRNCGAVTDEA